jgi:DNA-binding CsgD family transcriptional regulator
VATLTGHGYGVSRRETEVCALTARGLSTAQMAQRLHISASTVQDHLKSIFGKTGARNRRELVSQIFIKEHAPAPGQPPRCAGRCSGDAHDLGAPQIAEHGALSPPRLLTPVSTKMAVTWSFQPGKVPVNARYRRGERA